MLTSTASILQFKYPLLRFYRAFLGSLRTRSHFVYRRDDCGQQSLAISRRHLRRHFYKRRCRGPSVTTIE
jgi:hypothetical protein